jgi:S-adenosylmethionine hydrolase
MAARPIFFLSDFGHADAYAGIVEAVILGIAPDARVVHLAHDVAPSDVRGAAYRLYAAAPYLPRGAIVLAVVDPGVGSERRALCVDAKGCTWVAPDNGLLEAALSIDRPFEAIAIDKTQYGLPAVSRTFHGRDVFGPAAAHLSRGVEPRAFGSVVALASLASLGVRPHEGTRGEVWTFDRFGNAITTLRAPSVAPAGARIGGRVLPYCTHYGEVEAGAPLALAGSAGMVELSVREGSARLALELAVGQTVDLLS